MKNQSITVVIPAKNEENNIARCIESVKWCNRILVMWMGDDKTGKIAKNLGAEVIVMNKSYKDDFIGVQKNINWAIDSCDTDWILRIDADEVVTEELKQEIIEKIKNENLSVAYGIPRKQFFLGAFLRGGDWAYDRLIRLFRPKFARYKPLVAVHEQFTVNGPVDYLKHSLLHYSHPTVNDVFRKFNSYTDVQINGLDDGVPSALFKMITQPPYIFLRWIIWHRGYRDGLRGIVAASFRSWYEFMLYAKYLRKKINYT